MIKKVILIVILGFLFCVGTSHALTIGPSRLEVILSPGEIGVADYYVQNETEKPIHVSVEPENWGKDSYDYDGLLVQEWIELDTDEFDLQPKEIKKLKLTVNVPTDVEGELATQIFFTSAVTGEEGEESGIRARLGAVLYVAIKGTEKVDAEIKRINISKALNNNKESLKIQVTVRNKGNVHIRPTGKVLIHDKRENLLAELEILSGMAVLPGKETIYDAYMEETGLETGKYKISAEVNYGGLFGDEKTDKSDKSFTVNNKGEVILK